MRRRYFITLLAGAAAAWPRGARAQQPMPVVRFLGPNTPSDATEWVAAFEQRLRELGWIKGRTITPAV